jgi:hypothetical protein
MKTRLPVRSALFKHDIGGLVVKWVTISESLLLYVFALLLDPRNPRRIAWIRLKYKILSCLPFFYCLTRMIFSFIMNYHIKSSK